MARHNSCLFRHDAGTNHPVKSILILNKYLRAGLTIRSQKVPDKFPYTFTGKVRVQSEAFQRFWDECCSKWPILHRIRWIVRRTALGLTKTGNF